MIPIVLYFLPLNNILHQQHSICIYKNITGRDCYGCGITRAILLVMHLQIEYALKYNKMVVIVLPILFYVWVKTVVIT